MFPCSASNMIRPSFRRPFSSNSVRSLAVFLNAFSSVDSSRALMHRRISCFMCSDVPRSSPRWHFVWIRKAQESVSLPSCVLRLLALPYSKSDGNTEARACTYTIVIRRIYSSRIKYGEGYVTYLRASTVAHSLTLNMKFCENFKTPRISADKRFYIMSVVTPHLMG